MAGLSFNNNQNYDAYYEPNQSEIQHGNWTRVTYPRAYSCEECYNGAGYHPNSLVVAADGACPGNGRNGDVFGIGVYFGSGNFFHDAWNEAGATCQTAELVAVSNALQRVTRYVNNPRRASMSRVDEVVVKIDSAYVHGCFTTHIFKWRDNGWLNARGRVIANVEDMQYIDNLLVDLAGRGVRVLFHLVPRDFNQQADELAQHAARELMIKSTGEEYQYSSSDDYFES